MSENSFPITEPGADRHRFTLTKDGSAKNKLTLLFESKPSAQVSGLFSKAHFAVAAIGWLIVTDFDALFDEVVWFHLLDPSFKLLDSIEVGGMGCSGFLLSMKASGPREFLFEFPRDGCWHKLQIKQWDEGFFLKSEDGCT